LKESQKPGRTQFIMMFFAFSFGMVLANLLAQNAAQKEVEERAPLLVYKGIDKNLEDLSPEFKERISKLERERRRTLEMAALQMHIYQYAKDHKVSAEQAGKTLFPKSEYEVDSQRVSDFYHANQEHIAKPFYQVEQEITAQLEYQSVKNLKEQLLASLQKSGDLAILPSQ